MCQTYIYFYLVPNCVIVQSLKNIDYFVYFYVTHSNGQLQVSTLIGDIFWGLPNNVTVFIKVQNKHFSIPPPFKRCTHQHFFKAKNCYEMIKMSLI